MEPGVSQGEFLLSAAGGGDFEGFELPGAPGRILGTLGLEFRLIV